MAMIKCHECGKDISSTADKCPHCGAVPKALANAQGCFAIISLLGVAAAMFWFFSPSKPAAVELNADYERARAAERQAASDAKDAEIRAKIQVGVQHAAPSATATGFVPVLGKIWDGVELYHSVAGGPMKKIGYVAGGNDDYVMIQYPSGKVEPKDRAYIVQSGEWFVRSDDPAIAAMRWTVY